jgi:hypothetical protein
MKFIFTQALEYEPGRHQAAFVFFLQVYLIEIGASAFKMHKN